MDAASLNSLRVLDALLPVAPSFAHSDSASTADSSSSFFSCFSFPTWEKVVLVCDTIVIIAGMVHFFFMKLPLYSICLAIYGIARLIVRNQVGTNHARCEELQTQLEEKDRIIAKQKEELVKKKKKSSDNTAHVEQQRLELEQQNTELVQAKEKTKEARERRDRYKAEVAQLQQDKSRLEREKQELMASVAAQRVLARA